MAVVNRRAFLQGLGLAAAGAPLVAAAGSEPSGIDVQFTGNILGGTPEEFAAAMMPYIQEATRDATSRDELERQRRALPAPWSETISGYKATP